MATKKTARAATKRAPDATAKKPTATRRATKTKRHGDAPAHGRVEQARAIATRLAEAVPEAVCELRFQNAFELLIATILSAQSTDKTVNAVTPEVFRRWPDAASLAKAEQDEVEEVIRRTGFYRNKAKSIRETAQRLVDAFGGKVPRSLDELVTCPGVARKTANVVLGTAYGIASGFVVDTHVARVSTRLGLTEQTDPTKIEADLCALYPPEHWVDMGHRVLLHGRYTCSAKKPMCSACPLNELCPAKLEDPEGSVKQRAHAEAARVRENLSL